MSDDSTRIFDFNPDSPEFRAFFRVDAETEAIETKNVWRVGLGLLGRPPQTLAIAIHYYADEQGELDSMNLGVDLKLARALHQALGQTLGLIDS